MLALSLFIVVLISICALSCCLIGFRRAAKQEKLVGLLVRLQSPIERPAGRNSGKLIEFRAPKPRPVEPAIKRAGMNRRAVNLVDLAILMGIRGAGVRMAASGALLKTR